MEWTNIGGISIMADMERIEKALEGNGLALSAVAEVLHKMDARLAKADEDEEEKRQDEEDAVEKQTEEVTEETSEENETEEE